MVASTASSDEGEIKDRRAEKATTTRQLEGIPVDSRSRNRSSNSSRSPEDKSSRPQDRRVADRSRSPYAESTSSRGLKRTRDDDYPDRSRDPRRFKVHYEESSRDYSRRSHISYHDIDRASPSTSDLRYDERDTYTDRSHRSRSRSPYRANRDGSRNSNGGSTMKGGSRYDKHADSGRRGFERAHPGSRDARDHQSVSNRGQGPLPADTTRREAKTTKGRFQESDNERLVSSPVQSGNNGEAAIIQDIIKDEFVDEAALIEERRKRREAIKAKYRASATPLLVQALHLGDKSAQSTTRPADDSSEISAGSPGLSTPATPMDPGSPTAFIITNDLDLANDHGTSAANTNDESSAADYDPMMDMKDDRQRDDQRHTDEAFSGAYNETEHTTEQDVLLPAGSGAPEEAQKEDDDFDMFAEAADEDDDVHAEQAPKSGVPVSDMAIAVPIPQAKALNIGMIDNWDDTEGYYKIILGELLNNRYHVQANLGKGMFSGVVRATDVTSKEVVAIKLIRNNETMRKAGMKEIEILLRINEADPEDKKHMIRLIRHFEHKGHLCMVFENLSLNLREVLKKFGRDVGINIRAVRAYAHQILLGLSLMRKCNILHADLKPDNILVNETRNMLKICDLGSASDASENEITPYLVSRFYRAPEIILGMRYDFAIDIWSVGCTLYELYTGKILFRGHTNNQMLRSIMDCRGKFTTKMLKRSEFAHVHFDELANFRSVEQDKLTGKDIIKTLAFAKPSKDLRARLMQASNGLSEIEMKELNLFADLLDRCLALNPEKRITPAEALKHPFISRKV